MNYAAIIVAAGTGSRMGLGYNKVFYEIEDGVTVLDKSLSVFLSDERCKEIVLVLNKNDLAHKLKTECGKIVRVSGGATRQESVYHGLVAIKEDYVLIHDGARPNLTIGMIERLLETLENEEACFLAFKAKDTLKQVANGYVVSTIDRTHIYHAQTPQAFKTELIFRCHKKAMLSQVSVTDDSQAVELFSDVKVKVVLGEEKNIKLTTKEDLSVR